MCVCDIFSLSDESQMAEGAESTALPFWVRVFVHQTPEPEFKCIIQYIFEFDGRLPLLSKATI